MRVQYTVAAAVAIGLGETAAIVRDLIYNGHVAARFERGKWIIPASEITRCRDGLPLTEQRRRLIMGDLVRDDGSVVLPRSRNDRLNSK